MSPPVKLSQITKFFGDKRAVNALDLELKPGEVYGFLGPNGAGKTTSLRILMGILDPDSGSREVLGSKDVTKVRERVGYLPEERGLYKNMTAISLIAYLGTLKGMSAPTAKKRAKTLLERFGLGDVAHKKIKTFSKGMAQKVQVLATVIHAPDLVVFDEPFSGLDPVNQSVLEGLIGELKRAGKTVIFSTHVMQHAERLCDRLHILAHGETQFSGSLKEAQRLLPTQLEIISAEQPPNGALDPFSPTHTIRQDGMHQLCINLNGTKVDDVLRNCISAGVAIEDISVHHPTLHDVFIHLVKNAGDSQ